MGDNATLVASERVLESDRGIPGFPAVRRFVLQPLDEAGMFQILESLEDESLSIVVCPPWLLVPGYEAEVPDSYQAEPEG